MALLATPPSDALVIAMVEAGEHEAALAAPQRRIPEGIAIDVAVITQRRLHPTRAGSLFDRMTPRPRARPMTDAAARLPTTPGVEAMASVAPGSALGVQIMIKPQPLTHPRSHRPRRRGGRQGDEPPQGHRARSPADRSNSKAPPSGDAWPANPRDLVHADHHATHLISGSLMSGHMLTRRPQRAITLVFHLSGGHLIACAGRPATPPRPTRKARRPRAISAAAAHAARYSHPRCA